MVTAGEALRRAASTLRQGGFASPRLDAEVLLGHLTGFSRETLLAHPQRPLSPEQARAYEDLVARRLDGCPVAYLVGHKEFLSMDFEVGPGVLIPRPQTETLVEVALALARRRPAGRRMVLADVGTGSGAIAVALARHLPGVKVFASDVSPRALAFARRNAARLVGGAAGSGEGAGAGQDAGEVSASEVEPSAAGSQVVFRQGDLLEALTPGDVGAGLDGVVANLPYVPDRDWEGLERNVRDFELPESLRGGPDGLDLIRRLAAQLPARLAPGGFVALEIGPGQAAAVRATLERTGLFPAASITVHLDLSGRERVVAADGGSTTAASGRTS